MTEDLTSTPEFKIKVDIQSRGGVEPVLELATGWQIRVKKLNRKRTLPNIHPGVTPLGVRLKR